jgi:hypothetical protein
MKMISEKNKKEKLKTRANEFGEEYTYDLIETLAKRIRKLSKKEIDLLWYRVGWIDLSGREDSQKALPTWIVDAIKENKKKAMEHVENLILESRIKDVVEELELTEKRKELKEMIGKYPISEIMKKYPITKEKSLSKLKKNPDKIKKGNSMVRV